MPTQRKVFLAGLILLTALLAGACFHLSDRPEKQYLNPPYVDVLVFVAGVFLVSDGIRRARESDRGRALLTIVIGAAMVTIHALQFGYDLARGKF